MVPFPKNYIEKDPGWPLQPWFWVVIVILLIIFYFINKHCEGGVVP